MQKKRIIDSFSEWNEKWDYGTILRNLKKNWGWGNGCRQYFSEFESNDEYFLEPENSWEYTQQFHIYLTDLNLNRLRNKFNQNKKLRVGFFKNMVSVVPTKNIWNQRQ